MAEDCASPELESAREARDLLVRAVAGLPEAALQRRVSDKSESRTLDAVLLAHVSRDIDCRIRARRLLAELGWEPTAAVRHLQWAPIARARLEAALAGVPDALLDERPIPGEWSIRQQLAHVQLTDIRYALATDYGAHRGADEPIEPPRSIYPARDPQPRGTPGEPLQVVIERLRDVRRAALEPLFSIEPDQLQRPVEWHGAEHTVGFRLHRFAQHDLEIAADIRATLAAAGHAWTATIEIAAVLREAWGEIEAVLLGIPGGILTARPAGGAGTLSELIAARGAADHSLREGLVRLGGSHV